MKKFATIKELVECDLNTIDQNKVVEVNLKDLVYVHRVLEEYMRFFHNGNHYPKIDDVISFLGIKDSDGAFEVLSTAVYKITERMLPKDIQDAMSDGIFGESLIPKYYQNTHNK